MNVTIMDILENADYNLKNEGYSVTVCGIWRSLAYDQLHNAITLLNKGYDLHDTVDVDFLVKQCGSIEDVPEMEEM